MPDGVGLSGGAPAGGAPLVGVGALSQVQDHVRDDRVPGIVHLGLGVFHRSHQAWYTQHVTADEEPWGITAFTGRRPDQAAVLARQNGVYTLITRAADGDSAELIDTIIEAHDGADVRRWRESLADPRTTVVTLTVTEAGYCRGRGGEIDLTAPEVAGDLERLRAASSAVGDGDTGLRAGEACVTAPGRLVDGLRARREGAGGPLAIVSCDNLTENGRVARQVVLSLAEAADPALARWIDDTVSFVSSMVDRITPATTEADRADALALTGFDDAAVVVAEPFAEWVLSGDFPAGRPAWETAGARFVDDLEPYEQRKLWLLNAGHSLLAYLGLLLGHETIDEAMADPRCTEPLEQLWDEAAAELPLPASEIADARAALRERFTNPRIRHRLRQIASDGSIKVPVRVVDPLRRRLGRGEPIGEGAATALAAWWLHLTRQPDLVSDPGASGLGPSATVSDVLALVAPGLSDGGAVEAAVSAAGARILRLSSHLFTNTSTNTGVSA